MLPSLARLWLAVGALGSGALVALGEPSALRPAVACVAVGTALLALRARLVSGIGLLVVAAGLGALSASARSTPDPALRRLASLVPECRVTARVVEHAGGLGTLLRPIRLSCGGSEVSVGGSVFVDGVVGDAGALVEAEGWLLPLDDEGFEGARRRHGADASVDAKKLEVVARPTGARAVAASIRAGVRAAGEALDPRRAALLRGLTIGDTSGFDERDEDILRRAGLSHLVAVSGSNVAIVLGAVALAVRKLALHARVLAGLAALGLFVLVVGPEPSVLRAALMGAAMVVALALGRRAEPLHLLGLSLAVLIALRPAMVYSVGLHLSAAATAGLVLWSAPLQRLLHRLPTFVAAGLAATVAAQIAVAPILVAVFGSLSLIAPLANLLAVPAAAPPTVLGLAAGVVAPFAPPLSRVLAHLADPFLAWILRVGDVAGSPSWSVVELPSEAAIIVAVPVVGAALAALWQLEQGRL